MSARSLFLGLALIAASALVANAQVGKSLGVLEANTAAEAEIAALPHMNAERAKALVAARPFLSMTAFDAFLAPTLAADQRKELYVKLFVHINLNAATREEILMVPGIGPRMLREFWSTGRTADSASSGRRCSSMWARTRSRGWSNTCSCRWTSIPPAMTTCAPFRASARGCCVSSGSTVRTGASGSSARDRQVRERL